MSHAGGLECFEVLALLGGFVGGERPEADQEKIRQHVAACTVCESYGGVFAAALQAWREGSPVELGAGIAERLRHRISRDQ